MPAFCPFSVFDRCNRRSERQMSEFEKLRLLVLNVWFPVVGPLLFLNQSETSRNQSGNRFVAAVVTFAGTTATVGLINSLSSSEDPSFHFSVQTKEKYREFSRAMPKMWNSLCPKPCSGFASSATDASVVNG